MGYGFGGGSGGMLRGSDRAWRACTRQDGEGLDNKVRLLSECFMMVGPCMMQVR